jgi:menaquinone-specific isochorismate synthase
VRSRVLAGTAWPHDGVDADRLAAELIGSAKNRREHAYAVESLADKLRPFCGSLEVPTAPEILRLRNVLHLASNVSGTLREQDPPHELLRMLSAVHPTAAVGGTPTAEAVRLIAELERMDRERYAGPVGWIDADGNGEFGIALRCAQVMSDNGDFSQVRLFAGCGIVPDSDPDLEVAEAEAKLLPVREALEGVR